MKDDKEMKKLNIWIFIICSIIFSVSVFSGWSDITGNRFFVWILGQGGFTFFYWLLVIKDR